MYGYLPIHFRLISLKRIYLQYLWCHGNRLCVVWFYEGDHHDLQVCYIKKRKCISRTKLSWIKQLNLTSATVKEEKKGGKNMGVYQTLNRDTVNGWTEHDFRCDKTHYEREKKKKNTEETWLQSTDVVFSTRGTAQQNAEKEMWSLCDRRCNAKHCTVLWMGLAGTLWMEGIMWPQHLPKQIFLTDCQQAHTGDQPVKTIPWTPPETGTTWTKTPCVHTAIGARASGRAGAWMRRLFTRFVFFYEWRLWYVNECDWEKNGIFQLFDADIAANDWRWERRWVGVFIKERLDGNKNVHDFNLWLWNIMAAIRYT